MPAAGDVEGSRERSTSEPKAPIKEHPVNKSEIKVGGHYTAKVSNKIVTVRVDSIRERDGYKKMETVYNVTNLTTGRTTTFRSAAKFRSEAPLTITTVVEGAIKKARLKQITEGEQSLPPQVSVGSGVPTLPTESTTSSPTMSMTPQANPSTAPIVATTPKTNPFAAKLARPVDDSPHLIVEARAGTGKTTTLIEGLKRIKGVPTPGFVPSPQQQAVFEAMEMSRGKVNTICFVAFNKSIAAELKSRVPAGCDASTMHGMGFKSVTRNVKLNNSSAVNQDRVQNVIAEILGKDIRELRRAEGTMVSATQRLVSLCKMNLSDASEESILALAAHYEVELNGDRDKVLALVPQVLERCKDVARDGYIDFDDMIWLPVVLDLPVYRYDLLLVDEAQDLNRCQQALAKKAGKRLILCGDPRQAIYGFAGADADSIPRMAKELAENGRGCVTLSLTVTRRCGKAIVAEAKMIVKDFDAFETNPDGKIATASYPTDRSGRERPGPNYLEGVKDGDMVLCRVNAPLVSQCFRLLKSGRRANIQGRDIGQGLVNLVKKLGKGSVQELVSKIDDWAAKETSAENAKRFPSDARLIAIQDKTSCLQCFTEGCSTVDEVVRKIESVFTDDKGKPGVLLSSIHRAKGLEAHRVYLLEPEGSGVPHPMAKTPWQVGQEWNLRYVAITRAIEELTFVS